VGEYRQVLIRWKDEPDYTFITNVCIDGEWTEGEDDENVFFYFSTLEEFEDAKNEYNDLEFVILEEEHSGG
jgi:hypothetical protein